MTFPQRITLTALTGLLPFTGQAGITPGETRPVYPFGGPAGTLPTTTQQPTPPAATTSSTGWRYAQTAAPAGTTYTASLDASNLLQLAYPYAGGSTVTLTIRARGGSSQAYLSVSKGMFGPSYTGGKALIRINNGPPVTYALSAAANGRANLLFFDDTPRLLRQLRTTRTLVVQLAILNQKLNAIQFAVPPLRWPH